MLKIRCFLRPAVGAFLPEGPGPFLFLGAVVGRGLRWCGRWRKGAAYGCLALTSILCAPPAQGGLSLQVAMQRYNDGYVFWTDLSTNAIAPDAPLGHYAIRSPQQPTNGTYRLYENTSSGLQYQGGGSWLHGDYASAMDGITNGNWTITLTNATTTNVYAFQITNNGFASDLLPTITITYPTEGMEDVPAQPTFTWEGTADLQGPITVYAYQRDQNWNWTWNEGAGLAATETSWTVPTPIPPGQTYFYIQQWSNHAASLFLASTPLHTNTSQPLSGWNTTSAAFVVTEVGFTVTNAGSSGAHALVAHYTYDASEFLGEDSSGYANHMLSGLTWDVPEHEFDTDAVAGGGAVRFYGNSSMSPALPVLESLAGSFTVSAWVKTSSALGSDFDDAPDGAQVVTAFMGWNTDSVIPLSLTGTKAAFWTGSAVPPFDNNLRSSSDVTVGEYVHVAVTRNQATGEKRLYVNGILEGTSTGATGTLGEPSAVNDLTVGGQPFHAFDGLLDDLQFYSGVLSPTQVATLYSNPGDTIPDGSGTDSLGDAVNAPHLTWTTGGDAPWFAQTETTHDGVSAARSGVISDGGVTFVETQVTGPGTLSFWWKVSCDDASDFFLFQVDDVTFASLTGEIDWDNFTLPLDPGPHTLRWVYSKDFCCSSGEDAAWLDQVQFGMPSDVEVNFDLAIVREYDPTSGERFLVFPNFSSFVPDAVTYHSAESPNNYFSAQWNGEYSSSSRWMASLESAIEEITSAVWTLYVNKGDVSEQRYTFSVSINGLTTNILERTTILSPPYNSVGVASTPPFHWTGPTNLTDLLVAANPLGASWLGSTNLIITATNWPSPPALPSGTNQFYVQYYLADVPYASFTTPLDTSAQPVASWTATASLRSSSTSRFVVGVPSTRLTHTQFTASGLQFSFRSVAGHNHAIEANTNLTSGTWIPVTNFTGDGSLKHFVFPTTDLPLQFFRARTD